MRQFWALPRNTYTVCEEWSCVTWHRSADRTQSCTSGPKAAGFSLNQRRNKSIKQNEDIIKNWRYFLFPFVCFFVFDFLQWGVCRFSSVCWVLSRFSSFLEPSKCPSVWKRVWMLVGLYVALQWLGDSSRVSPCLQLTPVTSRSRQIPENRCLHCGKFSSSSSSFHSC